MDYLTCKNRAMSLENLVKANTKQVCEKIREKFLYNVGTKDFGNLYECTVSAYYLKEFLDQIEKGE